MKELVAMFSLTVYNSAAVDLSVREWSTVWSRSCDDLPGCALPVRKEDYGFFLNLIGSPLASQYIDSISRDDTMKIVRVIVFLLLLTNVLAIVSNINLNPTGNYAKISTKGGLYVSITILIFMIFGEFGYLPFSRFVGRKKRSAVSQMMALSHHGNRNLVLQVSFICSLLLMSIIYKSQCPFLRLQDDSIDWPSRLPSSVLVWTGSVETGCRKEWHWSWSRNWGGFFPSQSGKVHRFVQILFI